LLWLYPRAWRQRYAEEFAEVVGDRQLGLLDWIDIVSGAIDARFSSDVRRAAAPTAAGGGGTVTVIQALKLRQCGRSTVSTRDALVAAAVLVLGSLAVVGVKAWLASEGRPETGRLVADVSFPLLYVVVTNVWYLRGQSWRARVVLSAVLVSIFSLAYWIAYVI